jgi:hypothetical protein
LVVDPGSYIYTTDPVTRNRFRSTAVHSALQIDGAEQNELREDRLFAMVDRARATALAWEVGPTATTLRGRHHGFETLPAPCAYTRTLRLDGEKHSLEIIDEVISDARHELTCHIPLAPCDVEITSDTVSARFPEVTLHLESDHLAAAVERGWLSPRYGVGVPAPLVRLRGRSEPGEHRSVIVLRAEPSGR